MKIRVINPNTTASMTDKIGEAACRIALDPVPVLPKQACKLLVT